MKVLLKLRFSFLRFRWL